MLQKLIPVWTSVVMPDLIECTLEWHVENQTKFQLMLDYRTDPLPAHIIAMNDGYLLVQCHGLPKAQSAHGTYTLIGKSTAGDVMLNGEVSHLSGDADLLTLRIPKAISVGMALERRVSPTPQPVPPPSAIRKNFSPTIRKCKAAHRIIGNGLCIRSGSLHWFSHLRRFV